MMFTKDIQGNEVVLPQKGNKVLRDGFTFTVRDVLEHEDPYIIASITLKGHGGEVEVGYYDFLKHPKA